MSNVTTSLKQVTACQYKIAATKASILTIQEAIAAQQATMQAAGNYSSDLPELLEKRRILLADAAIGKGDEKALVALDSSIEASRKAMKEHKESASPVVSVATETIAGLELKLKEAQGQLAELLSSKTVLIATLLQAEAEQIGEEYARHAKGLAIQHRRLLAFDTLLKQAGRGGIRSNYGSGLEIALFNLESHKGLALPATPGKLGLCLETQYSDAVIPDTMKAEKVRLEAAGVEF